MAAGGKPPRSTGVGDSPALGPDWYPSRWGPEDQRGNGNLVTPAKVLEAVSLIRTGEIVSLGRPYEAAMPLAPGRVYALRMPGGPTGGPYGRVSRTVWNDEFISTEIGQVGTQMDALGHLGRQYGEDGDKTEIRFYNGNRLADMWSPYRDFDADERARYERSLLEFYHVFLSRVSEGRGMSEGTVDSVGQGRVWSGLAAHERGLVDSLGGLHEALELARERAHIGADQDLVIEVYPRPLRSFLQRWLGGMFEAPQPEEAHIPALAQLDRWYRLASTPAGALLALMPYMIEID